VLRGVQGRGPAHHDPVRFDRRWAVLPWLLAGLDPSADDAKHFGCRGSRKRVTESGFETPPPVSETTRVYRQFWPAVSRERWIARRPSVDSEPSPPDGRDTIDNAPNARDGSPPRPRVEKSVSRVYVASATDLIALVDEPAAQTPAGSFFFSRRREAPPRPALASRALSPPGPYGRAREGTSRRSSS
jgi:hypothetical protein